MNWFTGLLLVIVVSGVGTSIKSGLEEIGDSIKIAHGYKRFCEGTWYDRKCEWRKS